MKRTVLRRAIVVCLAMSALPVRAGYTFSGPHESKRLTPDLRTSNKLVIAYDLANVQSDFIRQERDRQSQEQRCQSLKYYFVYGTDPGGGGGWGAYAIDSNGRIFTRGRDETGCDNVPEYHATLGKMVKHECQSGHYIDTWMMENNALVKYRRYEGGCTSMSGTAIEREEYIRLYYCGEELVSRRYISGMVKSGFRRFPSSCQGL